MFFLPIRSFVALLLIPSCYSQFRANIGGNLPQGVSFLENNNNNHNNHNVEAKPNGNLFGVFGRGIMNAMNGASSALSTGLSMASNAGFPSFLRGPPLANSFQGNMDSAGQPLVPGGEFGVEMMSPFELRARNPGFNVNFNGRSPTIGFHNNNAEPSSRMKVDAELPIVSDIRKPLTSRSRRIISNKATSGAESDFFANVNDVLRIVNNQSQQKGQISSAKSMTQKSSGGSEAIVTFDGRLPSHSVASKSRSFSVVDSGNMIPSKGVSKMSLHTIIEPSDRVVEISRQTFVMTQKPSIITVQQKTEHRSLPSMASYQKVPFK